MWIWVDVFSAGTEPWTLRITKFLECRALYHWAMVTTESPKILKDPLNWFCYSSQHECLTLILILQNDYQRFNLIQDGHLPWNEGRKRRKVSMNPHGVCRPARPTSRWAPKAYRMMGRTQWRLCERSFGTNVLYYTNNHDTFLWPSHPLKRTSTKMSL